MRVVVVDTNVLISALIRRDSIPGQIIRTWAEGRFDLVTHETQLAEFRAVSRKPQLRDLFRAAEAGRMVNQLRLHGQLAERLPRVRRSDDPNDDFLLAMCEAGNADCLVTGDKAGLLELKAHGNTAIVAARFFLDRIA